MQFILNISILKCFLILQAKENYCLEFHGDVNFSKFISMLKQTVSLINGKTPVNYDC